MASNNSTNTTNLTAKGDLITFNGSLSSRLPVGSDGNVLIADSTQTNGIKWGTVVSGLVNPQNMIYVAKNGNDSTGNGTFYNPYLTIQRAINAATTGQQINVAPGSYTENLTINNNGSSISIVGSNTTQDSPNVLIYGQITLSGTTLRVRLSNLNIFGQTTGTPTIFDNGTLGRHYFTNCSVTHNDTATPSLRVTGGSNWINIDSSNFGACEFIGSPAAQRPITMVNTTIGALTVSHVNYVVFLNRMGSIGTITHSAGVIALDQATVILSTAGNCIVSTCALGSGLLSITQTSLQQANFAYGIINKTGTCPYYIADVNRNTAADVLTGSRLNYGRFGADINADFTPTNYSVSNASVQAHFTGINTALGNIVTWSTITGNTTAVANRGYITNSASLITVTLPATIAAGSIIRISGRGAGGWRVAQASGQIIYFGNTNTTTGTGGSISSINNRDTVELLCTVANTEFMVLSAVGELTLI